MTDYRVKHVKRQLKAERKAELRRNSRVSQVWYELKTDPEIRTGAIALAAIAALGGVCGSLLTLLIQALT